jgi:hypothetical protein
MQQGIEDGSTNHESSLPSLVQDSLTKLRAILQ